MIDGHTISVLITTYRRMDTIKEVVSSWLAQPVDEVWLLDGSGGDARFVKTVLADERFLYWPFPRDFQTRTDYGVAMLTDGDLIVCADDDVVVEPGFTGDLYSHWSGESYEKHLDDMSWVDRHEHELREDGLIEGENPCEDISADFVGIIGRVFGGPDYVKDGTYFRSDKISEPQRVGFVGVIYMAERKWFGFDTRGMERCWDDLWHQMKIYPDAQKYVVPTTKYKDLPCHKDASAHFRDPEIRRIRAEFFAREYMKTYAPTKRRY